MLKYFLLVIIIAIQGKCEVCPLGTYGETCDKKCSTHCALSADGAVHCDKLSGRCSERCKRGWHGDQCNIPCSRNCLNDVCNVQIGTCVNCKANYSGEYCETYKDFGTKECAPQSAQVVTSPPLAAILVPVFILIIIIIIALAVYILKTRSKKNNERGKQEHKDTDLHDACREGNLQKVREILDQSQKDINKQGKDGMTPVMWAARRGHRDILDLLVEEGADLNLKDVVSNNILHWACRGGNVLMVKHIISINAVDINSKGRDGRTPLMYAARKGEYKIFQLLVSKGGLSSEKDNDGNNILQLACWGGNVEMVEYILSYNVDINGKGQSGRTPLTAAAYKGHVKILDLLMTKEADPKQSDDSENNVLHSACLGGHADIVSRVLELNKVDINSRGQFSRTPLMMAARHGDKEIFDLLVDKGADATPVDGDNNTILHLAAKGGNVDIVKYVLEKMNVDINARNKRNETAAMLATNGSDVCNLLVQRGGLIQVQKGKGLISSPDDNVRMISVDINARSEVCHLLVNQGGIKE